MLLKRRILALCTAFAVSAATLAVMSSADTTGAEENSKIIAPMIAEEGALLGVATHFHLFAEEISLNSHVHGNIATNLLLSSPDFGVRPDNTKGLSSVNYIRDYTNPLNVSTISTMLVVGSDVTAVEDTDADKLNLTNSQGAAYSSLPLDNIGEWYQEAADAPYIDIPRELAHFSAWSHDYAMMENSDGITVEWDSNNIVLDCKDATDQYLFYKITLDEEVVDKNGNTITAADCLTGNAQLNIYNVNFEEGQFLYLTIDVGDREEVTFGKSWIVYKYGTDTPYDTGEIPLDQGGGRILYNFVSDGYAYDGTINLGERKLGSMLAPAADVIILNNTCGTVIAKSIDCQGESHRWDVQIEGTYGPNPVAPIRAEVKLNKVELVTAVTGEEVKADVVGATMKLTGVDANGDPITFKRGNLYIADDDGGRIIKGSGTSLEWVTGNGITSVFLKDGTYTLHEEAAPHGYKKTTDIVFVVEDTKVKSVTITDDNGTYDELYTVIEMIDDASEVSIVKVGKDGKKSEELPGASMKLTYTEGNGTLKGVTNANDDPDDTKDDITISKDGKSITWTSTEKSVNLKNIPNGKYTLTETAAPTGYEVTTQITFEVKDGEVINVDVGDNGSYYEDEDGVIAMFDKIISTETTPTASEVTSPTESSSKAPESTSPTESSSKAPESTSPTESSSKAPESTSPTESSSKAPEETSPTETTSAPEVTTTPSGSVGDAEDDKTTTTAAAVGDAEDDKTTTTTAAVGDAEDDKTTTTTDNDPTGVLPDDDGNDAGTGSDDADGTPPKGEVDNGDDGSAPKTGEAAPIALIVILIGASIFITLTKKNKKFFM